MANGCEWREISLDVVGVIVGVWMGTRAALGWRSGANVAKDGDAPPRPCAGALGLGHGPRGGATGRGRPSVSGRDSARGVVGGTERDWRPSAREGPRKATGPAWGRAKRINRWERAIDSTVAGALPRWAAPSGPWGVCQGGGGPRRRHPPSTPGQRWRGLANAAARGWCRASQLRGSAGLAYQVPTARPMAAPPYPPTKRPMDAPMLPAIVERWPPMSPP